MNEIKTIWTETIFLMPNWKWSFCAGLLSLGFILVPILKIVFHRLRHINRIRMAHPILRHFSEFAIETPLAWLLVCALWRISFQAIDVVPKVESVTNVLAQLIETLAVLRLAYLFVESLGVWLREVVHNSDHELGHQVVTLATKTGKILVVIFGTVILMQNLGFNVVHLLAGLGLGGLALALAAQDTAANLFGSITIILDSPFRVGDWIKVGDTEGTIEEIGFRSTRVRTFYQSLITVPNSIMAKEKIDNMGVRPTRRIKNTFVLNINTTNQKVLDFVDGLRTLAMNQPHLDPNSVSVNVTGIAEAQLQILAVFFIRPPTSTDEAEVQQNFVLQVKELAEISEVEFAFPTRTLLMDSGPQLITDGKESFASAPEIPLR